MSLCAICGSEESTGLCAHHPVGDRDFAVNNRIMCDFFHRGIVLPRKPEDRLTWEYFATPPSRDFEPVEVAG